MKYRSKMSKNTSQKVFKKTVNKTHYKNVAPKLIRGGTRL